MIKINLKAKCSEININENGAKISFVSKSAKVAGGQTDSDFAIVYQTKDIETMPFKVNGIYKIEIDTENELL